MEQKNMLKVVECFFSLSYD